MYMGLEAFFDTFINSTTYHIFTVMTKTMSSIIVSSISKLEANMFY